jgi:hypothetical protein
VCLLHPCVYTWKSAVDVGVVHEGLKDHHAVDGIAALWIGFYIAGCISSSDVLCVLADSKAAGW